MAGGDAGWVPCEMHPPPPAVPSPPLAPPLSPPAPPDTTEMRNLVLIASVSGSLGFFVCLCMYYCWIRSRRRNASSNRLEVRGVRRPADQSTEFANVQRARVVSVTRHADVPREHVGIGAATAEAIIQECRELRKEHRELFELFVQASRRGFAPPPPRPPPEVTPMMMRSAAGDEPAIVIEDGEDGAYADADEGAEGYPDDTSEQGMHDAASDAADEDERVSGSNDNDVTNSDARAANNA